MLTIDWTKVKHFSPYENWGDVTKLNPLLVYSLDALRDFVGKPIIINNAYRHNDPKEHGKGNAADIVIVGMHVLDQFLTAEKTRLFAGLGVYPFWARPGLHVDVRELASHEHGARWGCNAAGIYVKLDKKFLKSIP